MTTIGQIMAFTFKSNYSREKHFIIHLKDSQDIVLFGDNVIETLDALKYVYFQHFGANMPVYILPENLQI
jgi:hypothetical protein